MAIDYHSILITKGFYCHEKCVCSGVKIHKYRHPSMYMDIKIFPDAKAFIIYKNLVRAARGKLTIFETQLNSLLL